ncbi:CRTAC1 family protein [Segetibacter sp. 3557_3]|uniref:CRTAC1 family protein n=1 Tax=Segetibacter sp. 3557_3 TaxID=2547429 RepID=UPI001058E9F6|nr:CRTAC1 family protein [Segetibacter sp. 3557_3]TDH29249.1 CRTAC1 family protein [Segetibacter sp. 3557_3]
MVKKTWLTGIFTLMVLTTFSQQQSTLKTRRFVPAELADTSWLDSLRHVQLANAKDIGVFHDFTFTDALAATGISFRGNIVDDAGKTYKAVHYDHGTGIAVADVDGDGLLDIYFVNQVGGNQLWKNLGRGKFSNITALSGAAMMGKVSVAASFADIDNDGDEDLYVTAVRGGNSLFENDGHGKFRDISVSSGLNYKGHSSGAVFFDYNNDGKLDLFLANVGKYTTSVLGGDKYTYYVGFEDGFEGHLHPERNESSLLFRNDGRNKFTNVTTAVGLTDYSWSGDASIVDVNEDGWPDIYLLNMQGDDQYYENAGGKKFVRKSREIFPRTSWGAMGVKVFDVNNDGRLDIYITDMHSDMSHEVGPELEHMKSMMMWPKSFRGTGMTSIWGNSLFIRDGPGKFHEASDQMNAENYWPWGPSIGDLNADGYDDIFVAAGMSYPFRYSVNSVKLNDGGKRFANAEFVLGIEPRKDGTTMPWFELDASGKDRSHPDAAGANGRLSIWGSKSTRSAVIFDVDGDGDLDIVTNEFNNVPMVLESNLSTKTSIHYINVKLVGSTSNRDGFGAVVTVTAGGSKYVKAMDGKSGYLSQSAMPLYFGLGAATSVDRIDIAWPSGKKQAVTTGINMNGTTTVREQ